MEVVLKMTPRDAALLMAFIGPLSTNHLVAFMGQMHAYRGGNGFFTSKRQKDIADALSNLYGALNQIGLNYQKTLTNGE